MAFAGLAARRDSVLIVPVRVTGATAVTASLTAFVASVAALDPSGLTPFGPAKWAAVTSTFTVLAYVLVGRGTRPVDRPSLGLWASFLVIALAAALLGNDLLYAIAGTPERHFGVATWTMCAGAFFAGQQLRDRERAALADAVSVLGGVAGAAALAQLAGWIPLELVGTTTRPGSVMGSPAFLGALTTFTTPVAVAAALRRDRRRGGRVTLIAAAACSAAGLVASGARAAWVGGVVALLLAIALVGRRRLFGRAPATVLAVAGAGVLFLVVAGVVGGAWDRAAGTFTDTRGGARGRLDEWRVATRVIADAPFIGVGPEGYRIAFASAVDADYERRHGRTPLPDRAHSAVLDVAATTGIAGAAIFLALLGRVTQRVRRSLRDRATTADRGLAIGAAAYAVQSLFLFPLAELDPLVWLTVGSLTAGSTAVIRTVRLRILRVLTAGAATIAIAAGTLDIAADRAARDVAVALAAGRSPAEPARPASLRPDVLRYHLLAVRSLDASTRPGSHASALRHLEAARRLSPDDPVAAAEEARVLLDRARATTSRADAAVARDALRAIARRDPLNAQNHLRLGVAHTLAGDRESATRAWLLARDLAPRSDAALTNLAIAAAQDGRDDDAVDAAQRAIGATDGT